MSEDPSSSNTSERQQEKSWLDKLVSAFSTEPKSRDELLNIIKDAAANKVLDQEAYSIIEGALEVADQQVREIMIPRSHMVVVKVDESPEQFLTKIITSGHSRFPVIDDSIDDVKGILLAKDLLPLILGGKDEFKLEDIIRPATIIPESKRLNILLREFRENRYHMALVIDEYGGISGLVTIEDILEEIVGEIEDETDAEEDDGNIRPFSDNGFLVKALTSIEDFNEHFGTYYDEAEFDTIGGIITQQFGHLPAKDESVKVGELNFTILAADNRRIRLMQVTPISDEANETAPES